MLTSTLFYQASVLNTENSLPEYNAVQFTLVDCPGHASLIRTIIGGAQIMDMMFLVIDVTKGIQTQTAEGLVIGEITTDKMIVILNKIDLFPEETRQTQVEKMKQRLRKTLASTKFANSPMIEIAASMTNIEEDKGSVQSRSSCEDHLAPNPSMKSIGIDRLVETLLDYLTIPVRSSDSGPFLLAIDHCFPIRGQGTVVTGTVISGSVKPNQLIEFPRLKVQKKVKSIQMFHRPVQIAKQGDRIGICITQLDAKLIERGVAADPGTVSVINAAIVQVDKIKYFKEICHSKAKMHITIGHETSMATCTFFGLADTHGNTSLLRGQRSEVFDFSKDYLYHQELFPVSEQNPSGSQWVLLTFETSVICPSSSIVIGSKLDIDIHCNLCRIAFFGQFPTMIDLNNKEEIKKLKIYKKKQKEGVIDRIIDEYTIIGKNLFKKETDITLFVGMKVIRSTTGAVGKIDAPFGKSGKFKVVFSQGGQVDTQGKLILNFKRYLYLSERKISPMDE